MKDFEIINGDSLNELDKLEENSIDSIVTDPPYELGFMGKTWDASGIAYNVELWKRALRVLKPGGYLLAFGGSRTFHRIACAIEDAGFEIRDTIMWLYGSGFPKNMNIANGIEGKIKTGSANKKDFKLLDGIKGKTSLGYNKNNANDGFRPNNYNGQETIIKVNITTDLAKQWQGWGTALKPSYEPIIVARKPFKGSLIDNVIEYGVGGINIDECRIKFNSNEDKWQTQKSGSSSRAYQSEKTTTANGLCEANDLGRFPANIILTYDETDEQEVCGGMPDTEGGNRHNTAIRQSDKNSGYGFDVNTRNEFNDSGSASRYFYCAKASKKDRDEGLDLFSQEKVNDGRKTPIDNAFQRGETLRKNIHPTVKPTELMQYLVRLATPKGGTILDPFNGSGSTGKAVAFENRERNVDYKYIGIELDKDYCKISEARIYYALNQYEYEKEVNEKKGLIQLNLFEE